mmetsp:Transcript_5074/g.21583  ORF Transcript_5074/g.21583 Transcript_5074/m.21583 type:complete len:212 (+) Transcript_5074:2628-3263(+)
MLSRNASTLEAGSQNFLAESSDQDTYVSVVGVSVSGSSPSGTSASPPCGSCDPPFGALSFSLARRLSLPPFTTAGGTPGRGAPNAKTNGYDSTSSYALSDGGVCLISFGARVRISPRSASSGSTNGFDAVTENATAAVGSKGLDGRGSGASPPSSVGSATGNGTGSSGRNADASVASGASADRSFSSPFTPSSVASAFSASASSRAFLSPP